MKKLLVLGAGTAGTMVVNKLRPRLPETEWSITIVDPHAEHITTNPAICSSPSGSTSPTTW